jgi:hypothetical protein
MSKDKKQPKITDIKNKANINASFSEIIKLAVSPKVTQANLDKKKAKKD